MRNYLDGWTSPASPVAHRPSAWSGACQIYLNVNRFPSYLEQAGVLGPSACLHYADAEFVGEPVDGGNRANQSRAGTAPVEGFPVPTSHDGRPAIPDGWTAVVGPPGLSRCRGRRRATISRAGNLPTHAVRKRAMSECDPAATASLIFPDRALEMGLSP